MFPSFNLSMFTEEDGTTINKTEKKVNTKKMLKLAQFCNVQRALRKLRVLKIKAKIFEAGEFLNIFLSFFGIFEGHFLIKSFIKKTCSSKARYCWGIELDW